MLKYSSHQLTRVEHQLKPEVAHFEHTQVGLGIAHLETEPVLFGSLFLWKRKFSTRELEQGDCHQVTSINKLEGSCHRQMKQRGNLDPCAVEDAAPRRHRRHCLLMVHLRAARPRGTTMLVQIAKTARDAFVPRTLSHRGTWLRTMIANPRHRRLRRSREPIH